MNPKPGDRVILNDGEVAVVLDALESAELTYVRRPGGRLSAVLFEDIAEVVKDEDDGA